ncbi:MAG: phosphotransferase [Pseudomonadota bacterium]
MLTNLPPPHFSIAQKKQLHTALLDLGREKEIEEKLLNKKLFMQLLDWKLNRNFEKFIKIIGGYSNQTYQIDDLVLRFPKLINPLVRNLSIEVYNLQIAHTLNFTPLEIIGYYSKHNLLITQFIPQYRSLTQDDFKNPKKIIATAKLVKKLHYCTKKFKKNLETPLAFVNNTSESFKKIKTILKKEDDGILNKINIIKAILASFEVPEQPSHGDLHHGNLIELNNKIQLIDWEVSSMEDPAYDIARLFCVSDLSEESRILFLEHYKHAGNITLPAIEIENLKQRIRLLIPINFLSIVFWARFEIQFRKGDKKILLEKTIATFHEKTLQALINLNLDQFKIENYTLPKQSLFFTPPEFLPTAANTILDSTQLKNT